MTIRWRRLGRWLFIEPWPVWAWIAGIGFASLVGMSLGYDPSSQVGSAGATLQVLGLVTVALGLNKTRRLFGRPGLVEKTVAWARKLPAIFRKPKNVALKASAGAIAIGSARASVWVTPAPGASLERRVGAVERNLDQLKDNLQHARAELSQEIQELKSTVSRERKERAEADTSHEQKLAELAVGGLHIELVGLVWLLFGVVFGTLPQKSAQIIAWIAGLLGIS